MNLHQIDLIHVQATKALLDLCKDDWKIHCQSPITELSGIRDGRRWRN